MARFNPGPLLVDYLQHQYSYSSLLQVPQLNTVLLVSIPSSSILVRFCDLTFTNQSLYYISNGCLNVIYEICNSFTPCTIANYTESFHSIVSAFGILTRLWRRWQIILVRSPAGVRDIFPSPKLLADFVAQRASCLTGTNSPLSKVRAARPWELTAHLHLVLRLRIRGTNFHTFLWYAWTAQGRLSFSL